MRSNSNRNTLVVLGGGVCAILSAFLVNLLTTDRQLSSPWHIVAAVLFLIVLLAMSTWIGVQQYARANARESSAHRRVQDSRTRERAHMLARIQHDWIDGLLTKQLHASPRLDVQFADKPYAVERQIDRLVQRSQVPLLLPIGTHIASICETKIGQLLILGAPGSGKTTQLLELTQVLLHCAQEDVSLRIPVVFNLSAWAGQRRPLRDWLAAELNTLYQVPLDLAHAWVDEDRILPLLDGLDEVAPEYRETCVHAINAFHKEHGFVPIVVCCRSSVYFSLPVRLQLLGAVEVQLPTQQQVANYLCGSAEVFRGLQETLEHNPTLWRFLNSPLMVYIAANVYRSPPAPTEPSRVTISPTHAALFERYVDEMLARRAPLTSYARGQIDDWLAWLGYSMVLRNQRVFHLENLEQGWLRTQAQQRMLNISLRFFIAITVFGLVSALMMFLFRSDPQAWVTSILCGGMIAVFSASLCRLEELRPVDRIRVNLGEVPQNLWLGLKACIPLFGFYGAIAVILLLWRRAYHEAVVALLGFMLIWLLAGIAIGLPLGLWRALVAAEVSVRPAANDGTRRSALSALYALLVLVFSGTSACGLIGFALTTIRIMNGSHERLLAGLAGGLQGGLIIGVIIGAFAALQKGGLFCLRHFAVRALLSVQGSVPWNYARFLDVSAERLLLQKIGGGYMFTHDLLRAHFARRYKVPG